MKCQKFRDLFSGYQEETLSHDARASVDQHLAECDACKKFYAAFTYGLGMMESSVDRDPPADFRRNVMARIDGIRQARPRQVKWWQIDWERVFTVRVSAKVAVIGLGSVLAVVMAAQLSPYNSVTAGFPFRTKSTQVIWGADSNGVRVSGPWGHSTKGTSAPNGGLNVSIVPDGSGSVSAYSVVLDTSGKKLTDYSVCMVGADGSTQAPVFSGNFSGERQKSAVRIEANAGDAPTLAQVSWVSSGRRHVEMLVLPARFGHPKQLGADAWKGKMTVGQVLKLVSERFGAVLQASGDMNKTVNVSMIEPATINEALYNSLLKANYTWHTTGPRVCKVEPRD